MSAKVVSVGLKGLEGYCIEVEVQVKEGFASIVIVGLPDAYVKESKERVSAVLHTLGFPMVEKMITAKGIYHLRHFFLPLYANVYQTSPSSQNSDYLCIKFNK